MAAGRRTADVPVPGAATHVRYPRLLGVWKARSRRCSAVDGRPRGLHVRQCGGHLPMNTDRPIWRSMLFVPAHVEKFVAAAHTRGADAYLLDLEDSVPLPQKAAARA